MVNKWMKRLTWMRISKYALAISLSLSLVFAGFTVYGARVGNFNIYIQESDVKLAIYMEEDKSDLTSHLSVPVLDDMKDVTFETLAAQTVRDTIVTGLGPKNDNFRKQYLAFSVVLCNLSERMVNYEAELTVISSRDGEGGGRVERALRVLVLKELNYENGPTYEALETDEEREEFFRSGQIYALAEESEEAEQRLRENTEYETEDFISEVQIFHQQEYDFEVGGEVKYTILMWLEGWDVDCVNDLFGGKIKMRLDIVGR